MSGTPASRAGDARIRAAETKRRRSRANLIGAATTLFGERGWYGTRVEDIAATAGVSTATAYNHFANKYDLLAEAYAPLLDHAIARARADVAARLPIDEALGRSVHTLARVARRNPTMTVALLAALPEIYDRAGPSSSPDDPRVKVPYEMPLILVLEAGQRRGVLSPAFDPMDVAMVVTGALLVRVLTRPQESAHRTGVLLLSLLLDGLLVGGAPAHAT